jgi:hypothetical protein
MKKHFLITGSTRSGSTYVGRVIAKSKHYTYLDEPCNPAWGIKGIEHHYPYPSPYYKDLFEKFFNMDYKFKYGPKRNPWKYVIKKIIGNKITWIGDYYKYIAHHTSDMLLKDPYAAFLSDYLHENHDVYVLVLVRHPMAFFNSQRRMNWTFDFNQFLSREKLMNDFFQDEKELMSQPLEYAQASALLWNCVYKVLHRYNQKNKDSKRWLVMRHEDICLEPYESFNKICRFLDIDMGKKMAGFISKTTNSSTVQPNNKQSIHLYRDTRKLAYDWKNKVSPEDVEKIKPFTQDIAGHYYDDESWQL